MRLTFLIPLAGLLIIPLLSATASPHELSGFVAVEGSIFSSPPSFNQQRRNTASLALQPEYYHAWQDGASFTFVPFARLDSADDERSHFDIREMNILYPTDNWEIRFGIGKVFWGATEFVHLVDIINQTDLVENINQEEKLGQPMLKMTICRDWGNLDIFILPLFRERPFPGAKGRLRQALVIDVDNPQYESAAGKNHVDLAGRYSHTIGNTDFGLGYFIGTNRQPTLLFNTTANSQPILTPYYEQIQQFSIDLQTVAGGWLWKFEALNRRGLAENYNAAVGGFEYTFTAIATSAVDIGIIAEYTYDDRLDNATTPYENDAMIGMRLAVNDAASSELLVGLIQDLDSPARILLAEASRRLGDRTKASFEAGVFLDIPEDDLLKNLAGDDYLRLEIAFYF